MIYPLAILTAIAGAAIAQDASTTIVSLAIPYYGSQTTLYGSVITTVGDATSYAIVCPTGTLNDGCGLPADLNFLQGPSTLNWHYSQVTGEVDCKVASGTASCSAYIVTLASQTGAPETSSMVNVFSNLSDFLMPVTITAGLEKLSKGSGSGQSSQPSNTGSASGSDKPSQPTNTGSASGSDKPSQPTNTGSSSTSSSTAGVPRVTQQAVLAGIAVLAGGAMMM